MNTPHLKDDHSSWPSRYYGRTRHLDLEKIYTQVLAKSKMQPEDLDKKSEQRRVRISTEAPTVYEYEPEYDADDVNRPSSSYMPIDPALVAHMMLKAENDDNEDDEEGNMTAVVYRPSAIHARSLKRLDLRPIRNPNYQRKTKAPPSVASDDDAGSVSSTEPVTPDDNPFPERAWSTSNAPPSPAAAAARKIDVVRQSINRIRSTAWIPKKAIQKVL
ncbi:hypothetical protein BX666DRAFT_2029749 [Dichotomocladium elegans]|nr:hypothetical protein BX666DRAFT_2029749 [Dichotomocladium elegans]